MPYPTEVVELCRSLKTGPAPIKKLSKSFQAEEILGHAFAGGLIQVGRKSYTLIPTEDAKVKKEGGKPVLDPETKRPVMEVEYTTSVENEWSWMDNNSKGRAPFGEVLMEESKDEGIPPLYARLTSAGLAATI